GDERGFPGADRAAGYLAARMAGGARSAIDPVRARDRILRGAGVARVARGHSRLHVVDLSGDPSISESDRTCGGVCRDAAAHHLARHLRAVAAFAPNGAIFDRHWQGFPSPYHRPRPLALSHRDDLHSLLHRDRAAAVPGAGLVLVAEILQRA